MGGKQIPNWELAVQPKFITIEGVEGSGKSTNVEFIRTLLESRGIEAAVTREPGGTPLAEQIRRLLLDHHNEQVEHETEVLLMFAARRQNVKHVIEKALESGKWVICDRFTDATLAYQGSGRGISVDVITALAELTHDNLWPDLTIFLDLPVEISMERVRQHSRDRIENESKTFFQRVRNRYLELAKTEARYVVINANQPLAVVQADIEQSIAEFIARFR